MLYFEVLHSRNRGNPENMSLAGGLAALRSASPSRSGACEGVSTASVTCVSPLASGGKFGWSPMGKTGPSLMNGVAGLKFSGGCVVSIGSRKSDGGNVRDSPPSGRFLIPARGGAWVSTGSNLNGGSVSGLRCTGRFLMPGGGACVSTGSPPKSKGGSVNGLRCTGRLLMPGGGACVSTGSPPKSKGGSVKVVGTFGRFLGIVTGGWTVSYGSAGPTSLLALTRACFSAAVWHRVMVVMMAMASSTAWVNRRSMLLYPTKY